MATFQEVDDVETLELFQTILKKHYGDLVDANVKFMLLYANADLDDDGNPKGPALKHKGWPAAAEVKINSHRDRVEGKADATIAIDGDEWPQRTTTEQKSIIDHELYHVLLCLNKHGKVKLDKGGRPALKLRQHDIEMGVFKNIAKRYADKALDTQHLETAARALKQLDLSPSEITPMKSKVKVSGNGNAKDEEE